MIVTIRILIIVTCLALALGFFLLKHLGTDDGSSYTQSIIVNRKIDETAQYTLRFPRVTRLQESVKVRINSRIEDEIKRLLSGNYEGNKGEVYKNLARQSVMEVADSFLNGVRRKGSPRFFDSLSVTESFVSKKIMCLRFFNSRNDGGAKDVEFVSFLTFDLKSGRQILQQECIRSAGKLSKIAKPYYERAINQTVSDGAMEPGSEMGFDGNGLVIEYNDIVDGEQAELLIPWEMLKKNGILREAILF